MKAPHRLAVRPQYRRSVKDPTSTDNDHAKQALTPNTLLEDIYTPSQRSLRSQMAMAESSTRDPNTETKPLSRQHSQEIFTTRPRPPVYEQELVIERLVEHTYKQVDILRFRVRWYGCDPSRNTLEPNEHFARSHVLQDYLPTATAPPPTLLYDQVA